MDRRTRSLLAGGLGLMLTTLSGCRTPHAEVPPGRPYSTDGQQRKALEFSTDGHPVNGAATANFTPNMTGSPSLPPGYGGGSTRSESLGLPGAAGGMAQPNPTNPGPGLADPSASRASMPAPAPAPAPTTPAEMAPLGMPPLDPVPGPGASNGPALNVNPNRTPRPMPDQVNPAPMETPGPLGLPDQPPGSN